MRAPAVVALRLDAYAYQGTTGTTTTTFSVRGTPEEVAAHLTSVCDVLRSGQFLERLEHERRVLSIEARQRGRGLVTDHLSRRFGATGPGLFDWDEWGLHRLTRDEVWAWAATRFTRANAVLSLSGPPPPGLRLELFDGVHLPTTTVAPFHASLPASTIWDGPAGLTALVPRSRAATGALSIYAERVVQTLRHEMGAAYSPAADYIPSTAALRSSSRRPRRPASTAPGRVAPLPDAGDLASTVRRQPRSNGCTMPNVEHGWSPTRPCAC